MQKLSENILQSIDKMIVSVPEGSYFDLPEKVLQFGTGVLLRGLPDYFIDKANKKGIFNGRIVMVKSTSAGDVAAFGEQNNLYTLCVRGIYKGKEETENIINASVSRILSAADNWADVLACASNPDLSVIISNTTEVGIQLTEDNIFDNPPSSFPGKLLAFLYQRYKLYHGDGNRGMVIIPTELIPGNGDQLQSIVLELSHRHGLESRFIDWLENANEFCNSLVDRIVPGKLPSSEQAKTEAELGYRDELMIMSEAYRLWAIETSSQKAVDTLSFAAADDGVKIVPDITSFRELKLRLLNGSHTFGCGLAVLSGFATVKEAMSNLEFSRFIQSLMHEEIAPSIVSDIISLEAAKEFASATIDRFKNPAIEHKWLSITLQYTSKMKMRNVPLIRKYYALFGKVPENMALGFAAFIVFMKQQKPENDVHTAWFTEIWKSGHEDIARKVLANVSLWETDLDALPGFTASVQSKINSLLKV